LVYVRLAASRGNSDFGGVSALHELLGAATQHAAAGRTAEALAAYQKVLALNPSLAEAHYNVGALLYAQGDAAAAEGSFATAERLKPQWVAPALALGQLYFRGGRYAEAEEAFQRARSRDPDSVEALGNLGLTLQRLGHYSLAQPHFERARELAPADTRAWFALRTNLLLLGRVEEAVQDFLRFEPDAPLSAELVTTGLMFSRFLGDPTYEEKYLALALDWPYRPDQADLAAVTVSRLQYCDVSRDVIRRMYVRYNSLQQQNRAGAPALAVRRPTAGGIVRLGYLSADFRAHVMGRLMFDVIAAHDRSRFSVHLYSLVHVGNEDVVTTQFRALAPRFVQLGELDDVAAARAIAADDIDVLVDLLGHSSSSRPAILLQKPAPVIITHLGYHGCIGLQQVDFKLTDAFADVADAAAYQLETPLALDGCLLPLRRVVPAEKSIATRAGLGISEKAVVFGAFVSLLKLSPRCLALWRKILERVPGAVLALSPMKDAERPIYLRRLAGFGIPAERIAFIPMAQDDAVARTRYRLVDVVLDTVPYTGGDTTAAALDMGVPVVTRVGVRHAERVSYSLLAHLGVTETVAHADSEYVAIACRLGEDPSWRERVTMAIAAKLPDSGLADPARYARSLEHAYERALAAKFPAGARRG
jgi:predicted O-linked N-acetylglucosamine transferase (SPINDLY family)